MRGDLVERLSAELVSANKHGDTDLADVLREAAAALRAVREARTAWAIVRPDGKTIHPESVRTSEHGAQWSIGSWTKMKADGFNCIQVRIVPAGNGE